MSATMTAPEQVDGLEKLITLASLRKEDIIATQTELRKQIQLTQEEQGRVAEAKSYIAKHAALAANLAAKEKALSEGQNNLAKEKEDFVARVSSENTRLETFAATIATKERELEIGYQKLAGAQGAQQAAINSYEDQNRKIVEANAAATSANERTRVANENEAGRLAEWEATLKAKAKRLRDTAAQEAA